MSKVMYEWSSFTAVKALHGILMYQPGVIFKNILWAIFLYSLPLFIVCASIFVKKTAHKISVKIISAFKDYLYNALQEIITTKFNMSRSELW